MDLNILKEKNPKEAEFVEAWTSKYQRNYDLTSSIDQADFYEALTELGRHVGMNGVYANLKLDICSQGISGLIMTSSPKV